MKTAKDVANHIITQLRDAHHGFPKSIQEDIDMITDAITAYADERVKEAQGLTYDDGFKDGKEGRDIVDDCVKKAVADALEVAATKVRARGGHGIHPDCARIAEAEIRALKDKP